MVRGRAKHGVDEPISFNTNKYKNGEFGSRSPSVGPNPQSMVEISHKHPPSVVGNSKNLKQVKKAISGAPL